MLKMPVFLGLVRGAPRALCDHIQQACLFLLSSTHPSLGQVFRVIRKPSLVVQWLGPCSLNAGGPGSIPSQGTRSHMPQRTICLLQLKIPYAATKTQRKEINAFFLKANNFRGRIKVTVTWEQCICLSPFSLQTRTP